MKSWLCASALSAGFAATSASGQTQAHAKSANELILAGLRPGRSTLAQAQKLFPANMRQTSLESEDAVQWEDTCRGTAVRLEVDEKKVIQSVTATWLGLKQGDCRGNGLRNGPLGLSKLKTGHGLALNDPCQRITELYGPPNSHGPSTRAGRELQLMFYAFDRAGSDVPQVMEVSCDLARKGSRDDFSGRVVEITLAFPSL